MKLHLTLVSICIFHHHLYIFLGELSIQLLCFKSVLFKPLYQCWGSNPDRQVLLTEAHQMACFILLPGFCLWFSYKFPLDLRLKLFFYELSFLLSIFRFSSKNIFICVCVRVHARVCMWKYVMCVVPVKARGWHWILRTWSYKIPAMWVMASEPGPPAAALTCWAIFPAPSLSSTQVFTFHDSVFFCCLCLCCHIHGINNS